jgi:hypothetical protein
MLCRVSLFLWTVALVTSLTFSADGQLVISTRSGVIHFFEGAVYLDGQPLESHPGKFSSMPKGGELRTEQGRAEVLLTPGVFLRIGERSTIRLVDNDLSHTRVELLAGSAVVDSEAPSSASSVTLVNQSWSIRFRDQGIYRIDANPPRVWVREGKAEVSVDNREGTIAVERGMDMPLAQVLVPEPSTDPPNDALSNWAEGRRQSITADNTIAANIQDPGSMDPGASGLNDGFTYYPVLGLPPVGSGMSASYSSLGLYQPQPGFSSVYLPGYTYLPLFVTGMYGIPPINSPFHHYPLPGRPIYTRPAGPVIHPPPAMLHSAPAPHVGVVGVHR